MKRQCNRKIIFKSISNSPKIARLQSLDGLRAFSIIFVIIGHLSHTDQFKRNIPFSSYYDWSDFGVHIFFVISGFLITSILLKEEQRYHKISLKNFYMRRVLRILPAYYFLILCIYFLNIKFGLGVISFISPLTFTTGLPVFLEDPGWTLGHTWSLAVEEQFYILYPFFLVMIKKQFKRTNILFVCVLLFPLLRIILYKTCFPTFTYSILYRGDCIVWGCLLAFYATKMKDVFTAKPQASKYLFFSLLLSIIIVKILAIKLLAGIITVPLTNTLHSLFAVLLIIMFTILEPSKNIVFKILNSRIIAFTGTLSYSIYLWQQFAIQPHTDQYFWAAFPVNIFVIIILALVSYNFIEKPFLKFRILFNKN